MSNLYLSICSAFTALEPFGILFAMIAAEDQGQNSGFEKFQGGKKYEAATRLDTCMDLARAHRDARLSKRTGTRDAIREVFNCCNWQ